MCDCLDCVLRCLLSLGAGFELINAEEIPHNLTISSRVINMTLNRSRSGRHLDHIIEAPVLTMDDLPEMAGRKAMWTGSLEGISLTEV